MDRDVINFAGVMAVIVASVAALAVVVAIVKKWMFGTLSPWKRRELPSRSLDDSRLEQLQQSIDAIAIEVERIAEAQRFSAKLLAGREEEYRLPR
jgi:hypothetical protein